MSTRALTMNRTTWYEAHDHSQPISIENGMLKSMKGFVIHPCKLGDFCLKPGAKHAQEFLDVGYESGDAYMLFRDFELGFDMGNAIDIVRTQTGSTRFSIPMLLGVTQKRIFRTVWQCDPGGACPARFVTAYTDRRV
nr:MAG TPA: hypothetical protein [Caudoviricetes sp.]